MLTNANHQTPDQRTGESRGPTEHPTPPHRHTAGHTGTRPSPHSATRYGCLPEQQPTTRPSIEHTAGPAKPPPTLGSQPTASRPLTQTCPDFIRQPRCQPRPCAPPLAPPSNKLAGYRSIQAAPRSSLSPPGSPPAVGPTTSPSRSCSLASRPYGNTSPAW